MAVKPVYVKVKTADGFDTLYPWTSSDQVIGLTDLLTTVYNNAVADAPGVESIDFSTSTGILTLTLSDESELTKDLDGRYLLLAGGRITSNVDIGLGGVNNSNIRFNISGAPQIEFTDNYGAGDMSWSIGGDDNDNSFKIHGVAGATAPVLNEMATPFFEITTAGQILYSGKEMATQEWVNAQVLEDVTVPAPTNLVLVESSNHVSITFTRSTTYAETYEVYSSVGDTSNYGLIAVIRDSARTGTITLEDNTYEKNGTIYYKIVGKYKGNTSAELTGSVVADNAAADVTNLKIVQGVGVFHLTFDLPEDQRVSGVNIYVDYETTSGALSKPASPIYAGNADNFTYQVPDAYLDYYHMFWVDTVVRT